MWTQSTSVTDGQTDGQTDRITITKTVQRRASHGKKYSHQATLIRQHSQIFKISIGVGAGEYLPPNFGKKYIFLENIMQNSGILFIFHTHIFGQK